MRTRTTTVNAGIKTAQCELHTTFTSVIAVPGTTWHDQPSAGNTGNGIFWAM
jgi:hypothetical protein